MKKNTFLVAFTLLFSLVYGQSGLQSLDLKGNSNNNPKTVNSTISMGIPSYVPGSTANLVFTYTHVVYPDVYTEEFTAGISLDFPPGVTVNSANNMTFTSTQYTPYTGPNWNGQTGDGALTVWGMMVGCPVGCGPIRTTQNFTVNVTIGAGFTGDLNVDWHIAGDKYASAPAPHSNAGTITLTQNLAKDLGAVSVTPDFMLSGKTTFPKVKVLNYGSTVANDFSISVVVNNGTSDVYTSTKNVTSAALAQHATAEYSMTDLWSPADGNYSIKATVTLAGDLNNANNEVISECKVVNIKAFAGNATSQKYLGLELGNGTKYELGSFSTAVLPMAEEWNGVNVYRVYENFTYGTVAENGVYSGVGTFSSVDGMPTGFAYDHKNGVMYLSTLASMGNPTSQLYTANMVTGSLTPVGTGDGAPIIAMDFANDGFLYGPGLDDKLYKINPATGEQTLIGGIGIHIDYIQDVSCDVEKNRLYTITCGGIGGIYKFGYYDMTTGLFNPIADMEQQHSTFVIKKTPIGPLPVTFTPLDMATNVANNAVVSVNFNENISAVNLAGVSISPNPGGVTASITGSVLTIAHNNFAYNTDYTVTIPTGSVTNGTNSLNFDVKWSFSTGVDPADCNDPSNIVISNITAVSATVAWQENGAGTEWVVAYGPVGFDPITQGTKVTASSIIKNINGLAQTTTYEVYVKANCAPETSGWGGPVSFTTLHDCSIAINNLPYVTLFDQEEPCWTINRTNVDQTWKWETELGSSQYACYYDNSTPPKLQNEWLITPEFDLSAITGNIVVQFTWKASYGYSVFPHNNYDMYLKATTNGTDWVTLWDETQAGAFTDYALYTTGINVSSFIGNPSVKFAFQYYGTDAAQWVITDFALGYVTDVKTEKISKISVFPNPAHNVITVANAENQDILILNMLGGVVANVNNASSSQTIDISNLPNGMYFVRVNSEVFKINVAK